MSPNRTSPRWDACNHGPQLSGEEGWQNSTKCVYVRTYRFRHVRDIPIDALRLVQVLVNVGNKSANRANWREETNEAVPHDSLVLRLLFRVEYGRLYSLKRVSIEVNHRADGISWWPQSTYSTRCLYVHAFVSLHIGPFHLCALLHTVRSRRESAVSPDEF